MTLEIMLLGPPRAQRDGAPVVFDTRKAMGLLAQLALSSHPRSLQELCELLYPGHAHDRTRVPCGARSLPYAKASARNGLSRLATRFHLHRGPGELASALRRLVRQFDGAGEFEQAFPSARRRAVFRGGPTAAIGDVRYKPGVAARRPSAPPVRAPSFTKGEVNRAGVLLLDLRDRMKRDGAERAADESDEQQLEQAWAALTWWRSLHARPQNEPD